MSTTPTMPAQVPSPPKGVAVSGIVFSGLFITNLVLIRLAVPADPADPGVWLQEPEHREGVRYALNLFPFTGIAFLWFMGVLRNRIGYFEDRFFATVFLGSGLMFVAMIFVSGALAQGVLDTFVASANLPGKHDVYVLGRRTAYALLTMYGLKMAAVFMFVTSTIGLRTKVLAPWVSFTGFGVGLVLLISLTEVPWIALLFPAWVILVSAWILFAELHTKRQAR